jgi:hypothetical protein
MKQNFLPPLYSDGIDIEEDSSARMYVGKIIRFKEGRYFNDKEIVKTEGRHYSFQGLILMYQRWDDGKPVETWVTQPGQKHPHRNSFGHLDKSEWPAGLSGEPEDPVQDVRLMHVIGEDTGQSYTFSTSSFGGIMAVTDLKQSIASYRLQHPGSRPIIELSQCPMKTKFGTRMRPDFPIVGWIDPPLTEAPY